MKPFGLAVFAAALAVVFASAAFARLDIPNPDGSYNGPARRPPRVAAMGGQMKIRADEHVQTARLRIPQNVFDHLRAERADAASAPAASAALTSGGSGLGALQTVGAGVALSAAVVLFGLWLRRSPRRPSRRAVGLVLAGMVSGGAMFGAAAVATGNMPPPSKFIGNLRKAVPPKSADLSGPIDIEVVSDAESDWTVELVVPSDEGR